MVPVSFLEFRFNFVGMQPNNYKIVRRFRRIPAKLLRLLAHQCNTLPLVSVVFAPRR